MKLKLLKKNRMKEKQDKNLKTKSEKQRIGMKKMQNKLDSVAVGSKQEN